MGWRRTLSIYCLTLAAFVATIAPLTVSADEADSPAGTAAPSVDGTPVSSGRSAWLSKWVLWPLGVAEFWLVGSLSTWGIMLWVAPLKIRRISDRLSAIRVGDWQLNDGTQVTLAHLLLIRAFVPNDRVVDAWIRAQQTTVADWHAIDFDAVDGVEIEVRGDRFAIENAAAFRKHVSGNQACLALYGESRRWDARVLNGLLRLASHPDDGARLLPHPVLPVVLDRKCLERMTRREAGEGHAAQVETGGSNLARLLHSELLRVDGLKADVTTEWLDILLEKHRVLVVVEDWHRTPVQTRNLVTQAYQSGEVAWLAIVSAGATMPHLSGMIQLGAPSETVVGAAAAQSVTAPSAADLSPATMAAEADSADSATAPELKIHTGPEHDPEIETNADTVAGAAAEAALVGDEEAEAEAQGEPAGHDVEDVEHDTDAVREGAASVVVLKSDEVEVRGEVSLADDSPVLVRFPSQHMDADSEAVVATDSPGDDAEEAVAESESETATVTQPPAGEMLERLGHAACSVIPTLGQALDSSNASLREQAVDQLSEIILSALPELETALSDGDASIRRNAAHTLGRIERLMSAAVEHAINDPDAAVRREAVAAIPAHEDRTLEPLIAALDDSHAETQQHAARALGAMGSLAAPAVPELIDLLGHENPTCRSEAALALGRIGSAAIAACPTLTRTLLEDCRSVRSTAAQALCRIGHVDDEILAALCEAVEDSDPGVRRHSVVALGQLGLGHAAALDAIRGALSDGTPAIRVAACAALCELGPAAREAIDDVGKLLTDESVDVRRAVVSSVSQIDLASVPLLRQALDDEDAEVRRLAAAALSGIGLAVMPRLLEREDADEILAGLKSDGSASTRYEERSA